MSESTSIFSDPKKAFHWATQEKIALRKVIMRDYLTIMQHALLDGVEWKLPGGFGSFRVEKKDSNHVPLSNIPENGKMKRVSQLNRIGYFYQLTFVPGHGRDVKDYHFETAASFRKLLYNILTTTQKDYPFYDKH